MVRVPRTRRLRLAVALSVFGLVALARFASDNPGDAVGILFVIPIAMVALDFHWRGGVVAAALGTLITATWSVVSDHPLTIVGYSSRTVAFVAVGISVGVMTAQRERSLRDAARWFSMSNDLLCTANFEGYFTDVNESWTSQFGHSRDEMLAQPFLSFVHPDDIEATRAAAAVLVTPSEIVNFENRYRAGDGSWRWLLWSSRSDGKRIYSTAKDVTERKQRDARRDEQLATVEQLARTDGLTGVMNRATWRAGLAEALVPAERTGAPVSVLMLDLDRFKELNDTEGHAAGDRMLKACTSAWSSALRGDDRLGRVGGDEFAVLLPDCGLDSAHQVAQRIRIVTPAEATCSIGLATWEPEETPADLLDRADEALYRAKREGRDRLSA
jgi:diguanylate cyclase (GGDEF)-like protein/PAS domain S-box-containing protein